MRLSILTKIKHMAADHFLLDLNVRKIQFLEQHYTNFFKISTNPMLDEKVFMEVIAEIPDTKKHQLIVRQIHFFDDGMTTIEPLLEADYTRRAVAVKRLLSIYLSEVIAAWDRQGTPEAERRKLMQRARGYPYQSMNYTDNDIYAK